MKKFKYCRYIIFGGISVILFIVDWISSNIPLLHFYLENWNSMTKDALIIEIVNSESGYHSYTKYGMILPIIFCSFYEIVRKKNSILVLSRYKSRRNYCEGFYWSILIKALFFLILHGVVDVILLDVIFPFNILRKRFFIGEILQIITSTFFFLQVGLVYEIVRMKYERGKSLLLVSVLIIVEYYCVFNFNFKWLPILDSVVFFDFINSMVINQFIIILIRSIFISLLLKMLYQQYFERKDLL